VNVHLLRHPPVAVEGVCYGQTNVPLVANWQLPDSTALAGQQGIILSSPLSRCRLLAEKMSEQLSWPVEHHPWLVEMNFGAWENRPWQDIPREEVNQWVDDILGFQPPGGESVLDMNTRVMDGFNTWREHASDLGNLLIVSHSGVLRCLMCSLEGVPLAEIRKLHIDFCELKSYAGADLNPS